MITERYVLIIQDLICPGDTLIYGSNLGRLRAEGMDNVKFDRKNVRAEIWSIKNGVKDSFIVNCNLLLDSYEQ
jgi:hypothetical protein